MKITVITVCYNSATTIEDTFQTVARQTHPDVEHVIVDGGSTDRTREIIDRHRHRIDNIISEPDRGVYDGMNKGLRLATGDVIGFLNADDVYAHEGVLHRVAEVMSNSKIDACYADLVYVDKDDPQRVVRYWKSQPYEDGLFLKGWMPAHPTFFVRRSVYERFGGFDLAYPRQSDFELTMRFLHVHKIRAVYIPEIFVRMRTGGLSNSSWRGVLKGNLEAYRAFRKHVTRATPFFVIRKILTRLPQFFSKPPKKE
ncbi:MAG: glycosyl transferase [candidate division Zixibacteria bacterium RBG_16_53_22]|nr:MAG: glycosyl transferase [candidate division Zixibacteria bacterium RBG_16_53_22]